MEGATSFGLTISFTAGLLSFLSPCVLPLVPSYITFITGMSLEDVQHARRSALLHALLFVVGFSTIFILLGAGATAMGQVLRAYEAWITRIGGVLVIIFGLYLLGIFNVTAFSTERRFHLSDKPTGYLGTVLVGIAFGAGWTPCIGPILGSILTVTASTADFSSGMTHLAMYSLGLAIPFLLAAVALQRFLGFFVKFRSKLIWVQRVSGVLMIVIGILLVTNYFTILATYLNTLTPDFIKNRI
jgi:cytochrome c-type biogenesis protein